MNDDERTEYFAAIIREAGVPDANREKASMDLIFIEGIMRVIMGKAVPRGYLLKHCKDNHCELTH